MYTKLILSNGSIELHGPWRSYMYSSLFLFKLKYSLDSEKSDEMIIPKHLEKTLIEQIELELKKLLEYYTPPRNSDFCKHRSRYMLIELEQSKYWVNYRTDLLGMTSYGLFYILKELKELSIDLSL